MDLKAIQAALLFGGQSGPAATGPRLSVHRSPPAAGRSFAAHWPGVP